MSKTALYVHLVFATKRREGTLTFPVRERLYDYIIGIFRRNNCFVYAINGVSDHIHILFDLHPSVALAHLVRELKTVSSGWIKKEWLFPMFCGWNDGYYAGSLSPAHKDACIRYIKEQEEHHSRADFMTEMQMMADKYALLSCR